MFDGTGARRIDLPTYAFEHKRYWLDPTPGFVDASSLGVTAAEHPLLGAVVEQADSDEIILTGRLSLASHPWLADHKVHEVVLVPGAAMVEMALHAGDRAGCPRVDQLVLHAPMVVGEHGGLAVQVVVGAWRQSGERPVRIYSRIDRDGADRPWTRHAEGVLAPTPERRHKEEFEHWPPEGAEPIDVSEAYPKLAARGYEYGPAFRGLRSVWRRGAEVFVEAALPEQVKAHASRFGLHPALLDCGPARHRCRRHPRRIGADQAAVRMGRRIAACRRRDAGFAPGSRSSVTTRLPSLCWTAAGLWLAVSIRLPCAGFHPVGC